MKKLLLFISIYASVLPVSAQIMWQFNKDTVVTWQYEWGDEFNADKVDEEKWSFWYGWARSIFGNKEQQYYSEGKNHVEENGVLKIIARKEPVYEKMIDWLPETDTLKVGDKFYGLNKTHFNYTSGMIKSNPEFLHGYFEIRFKAPKDKGMWPAFWLYGGTPNEEIDIMELKGERPNKTHVDTHCANECDYVKTWYGKKINWGGWVNMNSSFQDGYNVVAAEWQPEYVKYFVNGKCVAISKVKFNVKKALVANMAIPSNDGPFHPGPAKEFTESEPFEIDYIRVWNLENAKERKSISENNLIKTEISRLPSGKVKLKRKDKILFGKKADHKNEGVLVSLLPATGKSYILYILGLEKEEAVDVELRDNLGRTMNIVALSAFQNKLDFSPLHSGVYKLVISFGGKVTEREINLN